MENFWIALHEKKIDKDWYVFCKCKCGTEKYVLRRNLLNNKSTKCIDCTNKSRSIHGMIGSKFGKYTVLSCNEDKTFSKDCSFVCKCDCGTVKVVRGSLLRSKHSGQCKDCHNKSITKHGKSHTNTYKIWKSMRQRCNNINNHAFKNYGSRGIKVCERWSKYDNFLADMGEKPEKLSIDRINNDGNYEPLNCRWATRTVQQNNKRQRSKKKEENENR